jgi:hypothetical protein
VPLPKLTPEDRSRALAKAAQARRDRAQLKERLRSGELTLADVLDRADHDDTVARTRVVEVLVSLPGVGPVRAAGIMARCDVGETRRLRGLGALQRAALLAAVARA